MPVFLREPQWGKREKWRMYVPLWVTFPSSCCSSHLPPCAIWRLDYHPLSCSPSPNHPCSLPQHKLIPSVLTTWEPPVLIRWETFNCKLNVLKQTDKQYWVFHFLSQNWKVQEYMASGQFDPGAHILSLKICPSQLYILMTVVLNFDCGTWLSRLLSPF